MRLSSSRFSALGLAGALGVLSACGTGCLPVIVTGGGGGGGGEGGSRDTTSSGTRSFATSTSGSGGATTVTASSSGSAGGGSGGSSASDAGVGACSWARTLGLGQDLHVASDHAGDALVYGSVAVGSIDFGQGPVTSPGMFVAKLTPAGDLSWIRTFGGTSLAMEVKVDASDAIYLAGVFEGTADLGSGPVSSMLGTGFVAKLDASSGSSVFARTLHDSGWQITLVPMDVDAAGGVVLAGDFGGTLDLGGGPLVASASQSTFLARYDASGSLAWSETFQGFAQPGGVAIAPSGDIALDGTFSDALDLGGGPLDPQKGEVFLARFDGAGKHIWSKAFGQLSTVSAWLPLAFNAAGDLLLSIPELEGSVDFGGGALTSTHTDNFALAKLDPAGGVAWARLYGGADLGAFALAADGTLALTGWYDEPVDFGGGPLSLTGAAGMNPFLVKLSASGAHLASAGLPAVGGMGKDVAFDAVGGVYWSGTYLQDLDLPCATLTEPDPQGWYLFVADQSF